MRRFAPTTFFITGGLLVWVAAFAVVYVFAAVACARGFARTAMAGLPLIPAVTLATSLIAAAAHVWLLQRGYRSLSSPDLDAHGRFIGFVAFATSVIGLIALVLLTLPSLLVSACPANL